MSDIYSTLGISPKKRRPSRSPDASVSTPKKLRTAPLTPSSISRHTRASGTSSSANTLPAHLSRLCTVHSSLQRAISHALATCAISPTSDSGHLRNVVNHLSLKTYAGLSSTFEVDDLKRLCWLWEWDGNKPPEQVHTDTVKEKKTEDNPFFDEPSPTTGDWTRGSMGFLVSPATHLLTKGRLRVPAYGVGIEIEMDVDKGMDSGMAAVARWTSASDSRHKELKKKIEKWAALYRDHGAIPTVPLADLPPLPSPMKASSLTMKLATASPKGASSGPLIFPPTRVHSPVKTPSKRADSKTSAQSSFTPLLTSLSKKSNVLFPQTPRHRRVDTSTVPLTPQTPSTSIFADTGDAELPVTPSKQTGANAQTAPATPSTSRRQALYERVRQRSLTASPTKSSLAAAASNSKMSRDQLLKLSQDEMRRRCLLGRLGGIAESVWMLFSAPTTGSSTPGRKRRALPSSEVVTAIVKSSPVPISAAEANESLALLVKLCPFFLKKLDIHGDEWLEMPAPAASSGNSEKTPKAVVSRQKRDPGLLSSPGSKLDSAELIHRSPKRVKNEVGGLREVREIIRKELELHD
ncbi:hypothetical protein Agabi119p4_4455 [Agaricus bisporus var. burnettii]|uniref:DNA replication factor Cdt1 C-terminal domain-containing protein n=1 Tax=Agaricus bisporus var. burnettii TaxID=192524 RepID=A0A8H7F3B5_AGABI|nr:hypothetical protein Agabi119p4_4455 [Agaricus bisporus var. burnettii]